MIKVEAHCHTGASGCADTPIEILAKRYKEAGYGGIVVTNHISEYEFYKKHEGTTAKEKKEYFINVYNESKKVINSYGLKTFFSCEVSVKSDIHSEFILYGVTPEIINKYEPLFSYTQKELFEIANIENMFMYKTHPFRTYEYAGDPKFMHGAEVFNGHFKQENNNPLAKAFCEENGLIAMSGTDFHHQNQPITGGIYLPKDINTELELRNYVKAGNLKLIADYEKFEEIRKLVLEGKM